MGERAGEQTTREQLLDALMGLLQEGVEAPTLGQVAQRAGVSRMTLYRYFPSKQKLWESAREERGWEGEESAGTRERIIEAAKVVFVSQGFGATMETIATQAGVGVATIYRQFGDKTGLLQEFRQSLRPNAELQALVLAKSEDVEADLREFANKMVEHLKAERDIMVLAIREKLSGKAEAWHGPSGVSHKRLQHYFNEQIEAGRLDAVAPNNLATAFMGLVVTFAWLAPMLTKEKGVGDKKVAENGDAVEDGDAGTFIARLFVRGILPNTENPHLAQDALKQKKRGQS